MIALIVACVLCAALGALGVLVVLGAGKLARRLADVDDIEALADATRECTACSPANWGRCTCKEPCGVIRCTAWDDAITPGQLRIIPDIEEST